MFQDSYLKLDKDEIKNLIPRLNPLFDGGGFDADSTIIMARDLPFYKGARFLDIADHRTMPPQRRFVIMTKEDAVILDFTNEPIYELNRKIPIQLDSSSVIDYVRFFFSFVRGRHGRFMVVESVDDIQWRDEPPPTARKAVGKMIAPITVTETEKYKFRMDVHMMFKDSLFKAAVEVETNGIVNIQEENLLIEDIPVLDDTLGQ